MGILLPEALDARLDIAVAGAEAYDYPLRGVALVDQNEVASEENTRVNRMPHSARARGLVLLGMLTALLAPAVA